MVGTHGRGFWILDDITPLRQISETVTSANAFLFKPETAMRVRWDTNTDTPLPPDEAAGAESAGWRDHRLLPGSECVRSGDARDSGCRRKDCTALFKRAIPWNRWTRCWPFRRIGYGPRIR